MLGSFSRYKIAATQLLGVYRVGAALCSERCILKSRYKIAATQMCGAWCLSCRSYFMQRGFYSQSRYKIAATLVSGAYCLVLVV